MDTGKKRDIQTGQKKMHVLHVIASLEFGGGTQVVFDLMNGMKDSVESSVLVCVDGENQKFLKAGFSVQTSNNSIAHYVASVRREAVKGNWDVIHFHGTRAAFFGRIALCFINKRPKIVYTLHGFHIPHYAFLKRGLLLCVENVLNHFVDCLVCVSDSDKNQVKKFHLIQNDKIHVITNGIDLARVPSQTFQEKTQKRTSMGIPSDGVVLVTACRLKEPKNVSVILRALKRVADELPLYLWVLGDGPRRADLERETKDLGLHDRVSYFGQSTSVLDFVLAADIAILSSRWEGLPLFLLEASACQKPLLGSHVDGIVDVIVDGKTGFLFEENNEEDLSQRLRMLTRDVSKRESFGVAAFQHVHEVFDLKKTIDAYENLYRDLINKK